MVSVRWIVEANGTDVGLVRSPVRPDVDTVLSSLLQVEEHPTAKDAEECGTSPDIKYVV